MQPVSWLPDWLSYPLFWIYLDQTLLTGIFAVGIGLLTVRKISEQIKQAKSQTTELVQSSWEQLRETLEHNQSIEELKRKRESRAAKAVLPAALSDIHEYCEFCIEYVKIIHEYVENQGDPPSDEAFPEFPSEAMYSVATAIKSADTTDAKKLAGILAAGQVHRARLRGLRDSIYEQGRHRNHITTQIDIARAYFDTLGLLKLTDRAYDYGRGQATHIGEIDDAESTVRTAHVSFHLEFDLLDERIHRLWPPDFTDYAEELDDW